MWLVDALDAKRPDRRARAVLVTFFGMLAVVPALVIEIYLGNTLGEQVAPPLTYQARASTRSSSRRRSRGVQDPRRVLGRVETPEFASAWTHRLREPRGLASRWSRT